MNPFFNSAGDIIGFESESNLFNLYGNHFARYIPDFGIYVDLNGNYIGEIISNLYLLVRENHGYENQNFGKGKKLSRIIFPDCFYNKDLLGFEVSSARFSDLIINMTETITSLDEYLGACENLGSIPFASKYYRGHTDSRWEVESTLNRFTKDLIIDPVEAQNELLKHFEQKLDVYNLQNEFYCYKNKLEDASLWHFLSQAQHIGIPTALIDFSFDPTIALRFAMEASLRKKKKESEVDAAVFIYSLDNRIESIYSDNCYAINPFSTQRDYLVNLYYDCDGIKVSGEENRFNQKGLFLLHNYNRIHKPLNKDPYLSFRFHKIIIPKEFKKNIRAELRERYYPETEFNNYEMYAQSQELTKIVENIKIEVKGYFRKRID